MATINQSFISVDYKTVKNGMGEYFTIGDTVYIDTVNPDTPEEAEPAKILYFTPDSSRNEIRVYTDKGFMHADFITKNLRVPELKNA
jgi:hypothetical protein